MELPKLTKGQTVFVNRGYSIIEAVVIDAGDTVVSLEGHKEFLRIDCYAIPEELDRMVSDAERIGDYAKILAARKRA